MANYLHIAEPNKFTLPLCALINDELKLDNHTFLFTTNQFDKNKFSNKNVFCFLSRYRDYFFSNTLMFYRLCRKSDFIYLHGAQFTILFLFFPLFIRKLAWIINGADLYSMINNPKHDYLDSNRLVFKRTPIYISHIEGDAILANKILKNNAKFHYSPVYLSNVVKIRNFEINEISKKVKILVGNSNSKNNDHIYIFEKLKVFEDDIDYILCPLNYGNDIEYKRAVIEAGSKMFGTKFRTLEDFISIDLYNKLLSEIDIAVFNHWRQEALGVTLSLLSLGKIVYVNPQTTTYEYFTNRGFKIYDNNLLFSMGPTVNRDVMANKVLLEQYYSREVLLNTLEIAEH